MASGPLDELEVLLHTLVREPAMVLQLAGRNGRLEESLPCHPEMLRDALRRVGGSAWLRAHVVGVQSLSQRQLVRGKVYAVDGSGLGEDMRLAGAVEPWRLGRTCDVGKGPGVAGPARASILQWGFCD